MILEVRDFKKRHIWWHLDFGSQGFRGALKKSLLMISEVKLGISKRFKNTALNDFGSQRFLFGNPKVSTETRVMEETTIYP